METFKHLYHLQKNVAYKMYKIDSKKHFRVSVDSCLFIIDYFNGGDD